tara:strand:- start:1093 stop:2340 length:1248 start_codon:yes stop_codon:yes gene_type:complete
MDRVLKNKLFKDYPKIFNFFKKTIGKKKLNQKYYNKILDESYNLIENINQETFFKYAKKNFDNIINDDTKKNLSHTSYVEINNSCNINCVMCDTKSSTRKKGLMKLDLVKKSVEQLKKRGVTNVGLHTIGDPLANKWLGEIFEILRKNNMNTTISTNGLLLHKHIDTLKKYTDVCRVLRFSIDGATKETYEKIRFGGNWETLIENIELAYKELPKVGYDFYINFTVTRENVHEIGKFITFFRKYCDEPHRQFEFGFMNSLSPNNSYFNNNNMLKEHTHINAYCNQIATKMPYVLVDGNVSVCCRDYDGSLIIGNIKEKNIDEILKDEKFDDLFNAHKTGDEKKINDYNLCSDCYVVDQRAQDLWSNTIKYTLVKNKNKDDTFYQNIANITLNFLENIKKSNNPIENYKNLISKIN